MTEKVEFVNRVVDTVQEFQKVVGYNVGGDAPVDVSSIFACTQQTTHDRKNMLSYLID